jgi:hypothetical protein
MLVLFLIFYSVSSNATLKDEIMKDKGYLAGVGLSMGLNLAMLAGVFGAAAVE